MPVLKYFSDDGRRLFPFCHTESDTKTSSLHVMSPSSVCTHFFFVGKFVCIIGLQSMYLFKTIPNCFPKCLQTFKFLPILGALHPYQYLIFSVILTLAVLVGCGSISLGFNFIPL
jgi:hypothetical protein